jgi:hypothetical protein
MMPKDQSLFMGGGGGGGDAKKNTFLVKKFAKPIKSRIFFSQLRISIKK